MKLYFFISKTYVIKISLIRLFSKLNEIMFTEGLCNYKVLRGQGVQMEYQNLNK